MRFLGAGGKMGFGRGYPYATGGDYVYLYEEGNKTYRVHEFLSTGTSTLNVEVGGQMDILVVGGGGGGNNMSVGGGGGGAGGFSTRENANIPKGNYSVFVGAGAPGNNSIYTTSNHGQTSSFQIDQSDIIESGGGKSAPRSTNTSHGGNSGLPQNNLGGDHAGGPNYGGGGGGGAGGEGVDSDPNVNAGAAGGTGQQWLNLKYYGGGGGGGAGYPTGIGGAGGLGGGGSGTPRGTPGISGSANTGGGGGGSRNAVPGSGGSGIVIVRYPIVKYKLWTPSELTELDLWFDVSQETPQSDDTEMTSLTDFSGNGRDLTAYGTTKPKYRTNLLNGLPGVKFTGAGVFWTGNWQTGNFPKIWSPVTFSSVFNLKSGNANTGPIVTFQYVQVSPSTIRFFNYGHNHTYSNAWAGWRNYFGFAYPGPVQPYTTTGRGSPGIYTSTINASGVSEFRENGTALTPGLYYDGTCSPVRSDLSGLFENACASMSLTSNSVFDGFAIGGAITNTSTSSFVYADADNYFYEVVYYNAELSVSNRQKLEGYLAHKWGLTNNLPSDHPYKYEPPYR